MPARPSTVPLAPPGGASAPGDDAAARRLWLWLCLAAALVAHLGFVPGEPGSVLTAEALNYDDPQVLAEAGAKGWGELLTGVTYFAYKPVYFLSLKLDLLVSDGPGFSHAVNLLLFLGCVALVARLLTDLTRSPFVGGACALLLAVHPVHVESVAWIAGRKDVLSLLLVLLAHRTYRRARAAGRVSWGAPVLLLLGGLAKGTVWTYAGVLALDEVLEARHLRRPGALRRLLPVVLVGLGGVALDVVVGRAYGPGAVEHAAGTGGLAAAMAGVHAAYAAHVVAPVALSLDYAVEPAGTWGAWTAWAGLALLLLAVGAVLRGLLTRRGALAALAAGLWLLGLLPVNNVWPRTTTLMADRYLLLAALGAYLLLAALLARAGGARAWLLGVAAVALGILSVQRTRTFFRSETVWADATDTVPGSALAWTQRGLDAATRGAFVSALACADRAVALAPRAELLVKARLLRGGALLGLGRTEELLAEAVAAAGVARQLADAAQGPAARERARAVEAEAEVLRGQGLEASGEDALARNAYARAVDLDPENPVAHYNLGSLWAKPEVLEKESQRARFHLRRARELARSDRPALALNADIQYATVLAMTGFPEQALEIYAQAEQTHGRRPEILFARAQQLLAMGRTEAALADLAAVRREHPDHPRAARLVYDLYVGDGTRLLREARKAADGPAARTTALQKALERFEHAASQNGDWVDAWLGAGDALYEQGRLLPARERYRRALAASGNAPWIRNLVVRATVLEAAYTARHAADAAARRAAAEGMAEALAEGTERVDLGIVPLESELPALRAAAARRREPAPVSEWADGVLLAAAFLAVGDDGRAEGELTRVLHQRPQEQGAPEMLEAALFLRAAVYQRAASAEALREARNDYGLLAVRRPDDPLPRLRQLQVDLTAAGARHRTAQGWQPRPEVLAEARARVAAVEAPGAPELTPQGRRAYEEARAVVRDAERVTEASQALARAQDAVLAFSAATPASVEAGLLSAEIEMQREQWVQALRRLNRLRERFPQHPSVLRGQAAVYVRQYQALQDRSLLSEALRALQQASDLDPRDPRTALDASNTRRVAGDQQGALALAQRAATFENLPGGPAARVLAAITLAMGVNSLENGDEKAARRAVEAARRVDPASAASFVLEARILLERERKPLEALKPATKAKELEPVSTEVDRLLAQIHHQLGLQGQLRVVSLRDLPAPEVKDPAAWARLDEAGRARARAEHAQAQEDLVRRREAARDRAIQDFEAALRYDPDAEQAGAARMALAALRRTDPESVRQRAQAAMEAQSEASLHLADGRYVDAYNKADEALRLKGDYPRAAYTLLVAGYERLRLNTDLPEETRREVTNRCFEALRLLDSLDLEDQYPERHLRRGLLNEYLYRRDAQEDARQAALKAYRRFLGAVRPRADGSEDPLATTARARLADLERGQAPRPPDPPAGGAGPR